MRAGTGHRAAVAAGCTVVVVVVVVAGDLEGLSEHTGVVGVLAELAALSEKHHNVDDVKSDSALTDFFFFRDVDCSKNRF